MNNLTIVQSNDLVEAAYSLSLEEMRLICLASTKVDSRKPNIGEIRIDVLEYINAYGLSNKHAYDNLRSAVKSLMRKPVKIFQGDRVREIAWLEMNEYCRGSDASHVLISFSRLIEPYLFELKERFTAISFQYAAKLNTPFSFRFYQWLIKAKNLNKTKSGDALVIELGVEWMKTQAGLDGLYGDWRNFNNRVLIPSIEKINANTNLSVLAPTPLRTGRKITAVRFIYTEEKATHPKPIRPRLHRRPKVKSGSHAEGEWMRKNFKLLDDYCKTLKAYDPSQKMTLPDLRKYVEYARFAHPDLALQLQEEIIQRETS